MGRERGLEEASSQTVKEMVGDLWFETWKILLMYPCNKVDFIHWVVFPVLSTWEG